MTDWRKCCRGAGTIHDARDDEARERACENLRVLVDGETWDEFVNGGDRGVRWRASGPPGWALLSLALWSAISMGLAAHGLRKERR